MTLQQKMGTSAAAAFTLAARVAKQNEARVVMPSHAIRVDGEPTLPKVCGRCAMVEPHKLGHAVCILCEMEGASDDYGQDFSVGGAGGLCAGDGLEGYSRIIK